MSKAHLTDDQFAECVILRPSPKSEAHLAECVSCRRELIVFRESMGDFSDSSLAWSDARPQPDLRLVASARARRALLMPLGWALAAAAVVVAGTPIWQHAHRVAEGPVAVVASSDSAAQILQDNRLLESVNVALTAPDASPFSEYRLQDTSRTQDEANAGSRNP